MDKICMIKYVSIIIPFFISVVITSINCALIYENRPKSLLLQEFKDEFSDIQALKSPSKLDFGVYHFIDQKLGTIDLSNIKQEFSYFDVNRISIFYDEDSNQIFKGANSTISLKYSFSYKTSATQDVGTFFIQSVDMIIQKQYLMLNETSLKANASMTSLNLNYSDISFNGDHQLLGELIEKSISKFVRDSTVNFTAAFNTDINQYYEALTANKSTMQFQSDNPNVDYELDYAYDRIPSILNENGIFYHLGKLNNHTDIHREPVFPKTDTYMIMLNRQLLVNFFSDLTEDGLFDFSLTQANRPPNTQFNLNIESLGMVIPDMYNRFSRIDELKAWSRIEDVSIVEDVSDQGFGRFNLYTEIYHSAEMRSILIFKSKIAFNIKQSVNGLQLNFFLDDSCVDIISLEILKGAEIGPIYISTLKRWVENTIKNQLSINNYYLLKSPIYLGQFFDSISNASWNAGGFYISGVPFKSKDKQSNQDELNTKVSSQKFHLKFLN